VDLAGLTSKRSVKPHSVLGIIDTVANHLVLPRSCFFAKSLECPSSCSGKPVSFLQLRRTFAGDFISNPTHF